MARIQLDVLYCGICHSDLHEAHEDWWPEHYPLVPGHEAQQGGYSDTFLVPEDYAIRIPEGADLKRVAPLLCAGITTYSPLRFAGVKAGDRVGIAGFGGLGHMAVQYAVALGAKVTVFDITEAKRGDAQRLGAEKYVNVTCPEELKGLANTFDFILSTIPAPYDPDMYLRMLDFGGQFGIVGIPAFKEVPVFGATGSLGCYVVDALESLTYEDEVNYKVTYKGQPESGRDISRKSIAAFVARVVNEPDTFVNQNVGLSKEVNR